MSDIDKRALREELSNPAIGSNAHLRKLALALLDELEADGQHIKTLESRNRRLDGIITAAEKRIAELQEHCKADSVEVIYQCEFCHHDSSGDLQWNWEDVNKEFYDQYDVGRRGKRRVLYTAPPVPLLPEELLTSMEEVLSISDRDHEAWHKAKSAIAGCRAAVLNTDRK